MLRTLLYALTVITSILVSSKLASKLVIMGVQSNTTNISNISHGQIFSTTKRTTDKLQFTNDTNLMGSLGSTQKKKSISKMEENSPSTRMIDSQKIDSTNPIGRIDAITERANLEIDRRISNDSSEGKRVKVTKKAKSRLMENPVSKTINRSSNSTEQNVFPLVLHAGAVKNESFPSSNSPFNASKLQKVANSSRIKNITIKVVPSNDLRSTAIENEKFVSNKPLFNESTLQKATNYSGMEKIAKITGVPLNTSRTTAIENDSFISFTPSFKESKLPKMSNLLDVEKLTRINDVSLNVSRTTAMKNESFVSSKLSSDESKLRNVANSSSLKIFTKIEHSPLNVSLTSAIKNHTFIPSKPSYNDSSFQKVANSSGMGNGTMTHRKEDGLFPVLSANNANGTSPAVITMENIDRTTNSTGLETKKIVTRSVVEYRKKSKIFAKKSLRDIHEIDYRFPKKKRIFRGLNFYKRRESPEEPLKKHSDAEQNPDALVNQMQPSLSRLSSDFSETNKFNLTGIRWPFLPGPISCELDFELQPSFVTKLGEFDYVVSVQRQKNPDEPPEHTCTGVIYNRRFILIAPHCLTDNYGLMVTSTDDLCTIDEMIDVDYIIEHKNYDPETKRNDIALLKLKSEIHKRAAEFPGEDDILGTYFYAVGFGELMWTSFPNKVSKLLQKVPVLRKTEGLKEAPGTLHITTSHMDLTGVFRGDFGGALVNPQGKFVGLKARFVKRSTEFEVYTRVRDYLPWIKSMVAIHGS